MYIIAYDISNNKRRRKISKLLEQKGLRMNYSVFECFLSKKEFTFLKEELKNMIQKKHDSILFYEICKDCIHKREYLGKSNPDKSSVKSV